ncbi:MAG TPA: hypothetical protein PKK06_17920 [Phycisphaerae bacterium]|nr:hypothetical protein [Phycisphaerae bacterium]HNU47086.1 hypothetical protein [Phycisphaerae bacterium]
MTRVIENGSFSRWRDDDSAAVFEDMEFRHSRFEGCVVSNTCEPRLRSVVRRVRFLNCFCCGFCLLGPAIVEDALVDGLRTDDVLQTHGMSFKHVTLRGKIDRVMLAQMISQVLTGTAPKSVQVAFDEANAAYYATVDWALDISRAEFKECDIRGIPARLIRRDPETQVVVTREKALRGDWRRLDLGKTYWQVGIEFMLDRGDPDVVLVAPKRAKNFRTLLEGLQLLRQAGVAEPD